MNSDPQPWLIPTSSGSDEKNRVFLFSKRDKILQAITDIQKLTLFLIPQHKKLQ